MFLNGHIYRGKKPVHWSPSSMTALAEAELEYPEGHVSQSIYVAFPLDAANLPDNFPAEHAAAVDNASLAVWTTTPWTMPANAAVAVNDQLNYSFVKVTGAKAKATDGDAAANADAPNDPATMASPHLVYSSNHHPAVILSRLHLSLFQAASHPPPASGTIPSPSPYETTPTHPRVHHAITPPR